MEVLEAIKTRRSVRRYKATPVPKEILVKVLEAARWAPSWKNSQCWRLIVVRGAEKRGQLAKTLTSLSPANGAIEAIKQAPILLVACGELGKSGYSSKEPDQPATDKGDWYMFDVALAMQNLVLAAHSLGLGTVHVGLFEAEEAAGILDVPDGFRVVSMTPLGYPDEPPRDRARRELSKIVFYENYGQSGGG